jgi:hypothetical protein
LSAEARSASSFSPSIHDGWGKAGEYRFQARIKNLTTGKMGGWSWLSASGCPCQVTVKQIAGAVVNDTNNNGTDDSEPGLSGAQVKLYRDDGDNVFEPGAGDPQVGATYTAVGNGLWGFGDLANGTYFVAETNPTGVSSTNAICGSGAGTSCTKTNNDLIRIVISTNGAASTSNKFLDH